MHKLSSYFHHWELVLLALLKPLGFWGIGVLAAIDSSSLAIPMDLIMAGYVWNDRAHFWIYPVMAAIGGGIGALVPFYVGRLGGELVLLKRVDASKFASMRDRFNRHHWFAVMVPAAMPPPFPFKLFAFGAGVFEMRVLPYIGAVVVGRSIHYMVTAVLVVFFGPAIMSLLVHGARNHPWLVLLGVVAVTAAFLGYVFRRRSRRRAKAAAADAV